MLGIVAEYLALHIGKSAPAARRHKLAPRGIAYQRTAFGHAISHCKRKLYLVEESLDLAVERCAADDHLLESPAECLHELVSYLGINGAVHERQRQSPSYGAACDHGHDLLAVDLLQDKGHTDHQIRAHLRHRGKEQTRCRRLAEQSDEGSHGKRHKHVESAPVGMSQGKERKRPRSFVMQARLHPEHHISADIVER